MSDSFSSLEEQEEDNTNDHFSIPPAFICPLTLEMMNDPLMDRDGLNYEREAILEWLHHGKTTCPLTRRPLTYSKLVHNVALRLRIERFKRAHGLPIKDNKRYFTGTFCLPLEERVAAQGGLLEHMEQMATEALREFDRSNPSSRSRRRNFVLSERRQASNIPLPSPGTRRQRLAAILDSALAVVRRDRDDDL
jgi:hypothetical protein